MLPVQAWSQATMGILMRAVGPQAFRTGLRVEAQEWEDLMACKLRWQARAWFQEQQHVFRYKGPQDIPRRRRGNVFAPITAVNDATRAPMTGATMMQEFARQMETKPGRPASVFSRPGGGAH